MNAPLTFRDGWPHSPHRCAPRVVIYTCGKAVTKSAWWQFIAPCANHNTRNKAGGNQAPCLLPEGIKERIFYNLLQCRLSTNLKGGPAEHPTNTQ